MKNLLWRIFRKTSKKFQAEGLKDLKVGDRVWHRATDTLGTVSEAKIQQGIPYQLVSATLDNGKLVSSQPREAFMIAIHRYRRIDWGYLNRGAA
jgi:hypothetical protein